jgi:hypothetical protein
MKHSWLLATIATASTALADPAPIPMQLEVGSQRTLPPANVRSYSVGNPTVASVHIAKNHVVLEGMQPGSVTVLLILSDGTNVTYSVRVTPKRQK